MLMSFFGMALFYNFYIATFEISYRGCLTFKAEIIPIEPDAGNADEGKEVV